jgi:hypothetical protein
MKPARATVAAAIGIIVLVTAATATPLLTIPEGGLGASPPGTGNATVAVVSVPEDVTLDPGRQGGEVYYLRVPDATVEVTDLRGNPTLVYAVDIDALGYSRSSIHFLESAGEGRLGLALSETTLDPERLDRGAYDARIELVLRGEAGKRTIYRGNATVEVNER